MTRAHPLTTHTSTDPEAPDTDVCGIAMSRSMGDFQLHMVGWDVADGLEGSALLPQYLQTCCLRD